MRSGDESERENKIGDMADVDTVMDAGIIVSLNTKNGLRIGKRKVNGDGDGDNRYRYVGRNGRCMAGVFEVKTTERSQRERIRSHGQKNGNECRQRRILGRQK